MTLKTVRDLTLPSVPEEEEGIKDPERVLRWRKAHLSALRDQHEDIYDDLQSFRNLPVYANNAAAIAGGLEVGDYYRTGGDPDLVCIVH